MSDVYRYHRRTYPLLRAVMTDCYHLCTDCGIMKPLSEVGLRTVKGVLRNQAQCMDCRNKYNERDEVSDTKRKA